MAKGEFMRVLFTSTFFGISLLYTNLHAKILNECVSDTHRQRGCIEKMYWSTEIGESAIVGFQVPYHNGKVLTKDEQKDIIRISNIFSDFSHIYHSESDAIWISLLSDRPITSQEVWYNRCNYTIYENTPMFVVNNLADCAISCVLTHRPMISHRT